MTARWYKPFSSVERSGALNILNPKASSRLKYWIFFPWVLWGNIVNVFTGAYYDKMDFLDQITSLYDKLAHRPMPGGRVWARPG